MLESHFTPHPHPHQASLWAPAGFLSFSRVRVLELRMKRLLCRRGLILPRKVGRLGPDP